MMEFLKMLFIELLAPIIVSIICFKVQYRKTTLDERKGKLPVMRILKLDGRNKIELNKSHIKSGGKIVEISYRSYQQIDDNISPEHRAAIEFKVVSDDTFLRKAEKNGMYWIGFENILGASFSLKYVIDKNGKYDAIDETKVPVFMSEKNKYCFVCEEGNLPRAIYGTFAGMPISYNINGKVDDAVIPEIKKFE